MTSLVGGQTRINDTSAFYLETTNSFIPVSSAILSINSLGNLTVNGEDYNPRLWSNYSTVNSTITFNLPGIAAREAQLQAQDNGGTPLLYFDGNQLAYVSQIPVIDNWSLFSSISNVGIPPPYALFADGANISTATISSLTVDSINGGGTNTLNISSINAQLVSLSTLALFDGLNPNINLGLGPLFGNIGAWAAGGMGLVVGSAALITGTVGILLPRQTNYITQGAVEMVNVTTQLQPSTLTTQTSSILREVDILGQEIFTSTLNTVPVNAIRSLSDPFQTPSTLSTSYIQAFGQWCPLPNWAAVPALQDVEVNTYSLLSTTSVTVYNPASLGGNLRVNTGPSYGGNWLAGLPGALQPQNPNTNGPSDMRLRQLMFNDGTGFTNEVMLVNTTNSGRIGVNCATPVVASALAYLSDGGGPGAFELYVAKNGNDANPGTINAPFLTIGAAITARGSISFTNNVSILISPGTYTENLTIPRNTFLGGLTINPNRLPVQITGSLIFNDLTAGVNGISGLNISVGSVALNTTVVPLSIDNCNIFASGTNAINLIGSSSATITNSNITGAGATVVQSSATLTIRNCILSVTSNNIIITANSSTTIQNSILTSTATGTVFASIVVFSNTGTATTEITRCTLQYTSVVTDTGTQKCCVRFAGSGTNNSQIVQCLLLCEGAVTGSGGQIQCIQDTGAGAVNLSYGGLLAGATANHISPNTTKTALTSVP